MSCSYLQLSMQLNVTLPSMMKCKCLTNFPRSIILCPGGKTSPDNLLSISCQNFIASVSFLQFGLLLKKRDNLEIRDLKVSDIIRFYSCGGQDSKNPPLFILSKLMLTSVRRCWLLMLIMGLRILRNFLMFLFINNHNL